MDTPEIEKLSLSDITPYGKNPRDNSSAIDAVAKSIEAYGFLVPIIIDREGVIVAGHTRYQASLKLKLDKVPVIRVEHLTAQQANAFRLIDNKTAELATWDFDLLADEISVLAETGLDLVPFGWSQEEIDCLSQIVAADCISALPAEDAFTQDASGQDALTRREDGDGVTGAKQGNRGSSVISKDPKSVRVAIGEINFFVDIEQYREWAHSLRKKNGFDMQSVVDDLAGRLGLTARKFRRVEAKQEPSVEPPVEPTLRVRPRICKRASTKNPLKEDFLKEDPAEASA